MPDGRPPFPDEEPGPDEEPDEGSRGIRSQMADVSGRAVQARDGRGGVHFHGHEPGMSSAPVPGQLPGDVHGFVNRLGETEVLSARLRSAGHAAGSSTICVRPRRSRVWARAKFYRQAAHGYRRHQDRWKLAVRLDRLASAEAATGAGQAARVHWREALEALESFSDPRALHLREESTGHVREGPAPS